MITSIIAALLVTGSLYAASAAGFIGRLPLLRTGICAITAFYLLRGIVGFLPVAATLPGRSPTFWLWSSALCLMIGVVHATGLAQVWRQL